MSKLKVMKFFEAIPLNKEGFYQPGAFVNGYLKSEADKVIAHNKYKRCLGLAKRCGDAYDKWMMQKANAIALSKDGIKYYHQARWKVSHYMRWQKRWLELAEKFKEAK